MIRWLELMATTESWGRHLYHGLWVYALGLGVFMLWYWHRDMQELKANAKAALEVAMQPDLIRMHIHQLLEQDLPKEKGVVRLCDCPRCEQTRTQLGFKPFRAWKENGVKGQRKAKP